MLKKLTRQHTAYRQCAGLAVAAASAKKSVDARIVNVAIAGTDNAAGDGTDAGWYFSAIGEK